MRSDLPERRRALLLLRLLRRRLPLLRRPAGSRFLETAWRLGGRTGHGAAPSTSRIRTLSTRAPRRLLLRRPAPGEGCTCTPTPPSTRRRFQPLASPYGPVRLGRNTRSPCTTRTTSCSTQACPWPDRKSVVQAT